MWLASALQAEKFAGRQSCLEFNDGDLKISQFKHANCTVNILTCRNWPERTEYLLRITGHFGFEFPNRSPGWDCSEHT